ncbi:MAG: HAD family phosphatase [Sphingomonadales bacterium]|nr:HAD family phosphatase [Sphingomonadales bacterium]
MTPAIRTIVFDIGNVVVRWDPDWIIRQTFGDGPDHDGLRAGVFSRDIWLPLNLGQISVEEAKVSYVQSGLMQNADADRLFDVVLESMSPLPGSVELMHEALGAGYRILALSDNVHEFVAHYKAHHSWWPLFEGAVISAEIGEVKPNPGIYQHLLSTWSLHPAETLFMDDVAANVAGAHAMGMHAFQFTTADDARTRFARDYGITLG